jgi:peptide/nickel transport system permease protein
VVAEILPNVLGPILVEFTVRLGYAIFAVSTLSFLGAGVQPPSPDWGLAVAENRGFFQLYWWPVLFPCLAIASLVVAINLVADALREATS